MGPNLVVNPPDDVELFNRFKNILVPSNMVMYNYKKFDVTKSTKFFVHATGIDTDLLTPLHTFTDDHGDWKYETVIAQAAAGLVAHEVNDESHEVRWVDIEKVDELPLHPSFAKSWPVLKALLQSL
jgi:hypothetical protein